MCTVSFIPAGDRILLASNRDEKHWRAAAQPPRTYEFPSGHICFPRDGDAGGTWMAVHENGNALVLLNGAFENHIPEPPYDRSRGLVLLELIQTPRPYDHFRSDNLENIEPFTLVIWSAGQLAECRWDGERKHSRLLDNSQAHIWSSATLYSREIVTRREQWFSDWLTDQEMPSLNKLMEFHQVTGDGDPHNDLLMDRDGKVLTVSITGMEIGPTHADICYVDVMTRQTSRLQLPFITEQIFHA